MLETGLKNQEIGQSHLLKLYKAQKKPSLICFFTKTDSTVSRMISDPVARQILIESLAFENVNSKCKRIIRPLKARSAPIDEWIRNTADIGSHTYNNTWIGEVIPQNFKKN